MDELDEATRSAQLGRCRDPGFTPGVRDVAGLLAAWRGEGVGPKTLRDERKLVVAALARADRGVADALLADYGDVDGAQRAMRLQVVAKIARRVAMPCLSARLAEVLAAGLRDPAPRVVREAARAIAKDEQLDGASFEPALLAVVETAALAERRAAVEALGRVGGAEALTRLRAMSCDDPDLTRRLAEAVALIERRAARDEPSAIRGSVALPAPVAVRLRCRAGAASVVADQARVRLPRAEDGSTPALDVLPDGRAVALRWAGCLDDLLTVRAAIDIALVFELPPGPSWAARIVGALQDPTLVAALYAWTQGTVRFRLTLRGRGHRRALMWQVAQGLSASASPLVNDSRDAPWTVEVDESAGGRLLCIPRGGDPRFDYRVGDVPAASHPSLAALLAWLSRPQPGEVVWDPFCGSGSELVECATLAEGLHLLGTDVDAHALQVAIANVEAARRPVASVQWQQGDAREIVPTAPGTRGVTLIVSNPPMGRRVARDGTVRSLLAEFVTHAASVLEPGGRLVWVSATPRVTAEAGRAAGLSVEDLGDFDMGGFAVAVQRMRKPAG
jgi:precorrin-6B methylase 2